MTRLTNILISLISFFSFLFFIPLRKYFPWLPPPSVPPSVLHNIVLFACLPSLITGEVEVRMQQSEANRFSFGPGKDFPCQGYTHCCWAHPARAAPLSTPAFYCQNIFTTDVTRVRYLLFSSHDYATVMTEVNAQPQNILVCLLTCSAVEGWKGLECGKIFCLCVRSCLWSGKASGSNYYYYCYYLFFYHDVISYV